MTERTEWPTPEKLARLREEGIVNYSPVATACFVVAALAALMTIVAGDFGALLERYSAAVTADRVVPGLLGMLRDGIWFVLVSGAVCGIVVVVSILAQTRVLLRPERLSFSLERLNPVAKFSVSAPFGRTLRHGVGVLSGLVVAAVLVGVLFRDMAGLLNHGIQYTETHTRVGIESVCEGIAVVALFSGVLAWWFARLGFRLRHRMTRAEVLADRSER